MVSIDAVQGLEADLVLARDQLTQFASEITELRSTVQVLTSTVESLKVCVIMHSLTHSETINRVLVTRWPARSTTVRYRIAYTGSDRKCLGFACISGCHVGQTDGRTNGRGPTLYVAIR